MKKNPIIPLLFFFSFLVLSILQKRFLFPKYDLLLFLLVSGCCLFIYYRKVNRENFAPESVCENIQGLFDAILNKDRQNACGFFMDLAPKFYNAVDFFNIRYELFKVLGSQVVWVDWNKLRDTFLEFLNIYRAYNDDQRTMSVEKIDKMINDLRELSFN